METRKPDQDVSDEDIKDLWEKRISASVSPGTTIKNRPAILLSLAAKSARHEEDPSLSLSLHLRPHRVVEKKVPEGIPPEADYGLIGVLGEGGMGIIHSAQQISIGREIAVKMLKPELANDKEASQRFLVEAQVTGNLDHPNIVPIHDLGCTEEGCLFIAMKKVKGVEWNETIHQKSVKENLDILLRVCDAVAFAHSKNILHRDLKPENVMLGEYGEVILMDWGLVASLDPKSKVGGITDDSAQAGTPAYMPPEVARCEVKKIGIRSEVYMLGGILFEIVTGMQPHFGKDVYACLEAASRNTLPATDKKGELMEIAYKALATDPQQRHASVKEFHSALQNYLYHAESLALTHSAKEDLRKAGNDYSLLSRSLTLFEESVKLWPENDEAQKGVINTRKIYASIALARGDLDLGKSLIFSDIPEHRDIGLNLDRAIHERHLRGLRLKILTYGFLAFLLAVFVILINAKSYVELERDKAIEAKNFITQERETTLQKMRDLESHLEQEKLARARVEDELKQFKTTPASGEIPLH